MIGTRKLIKMAQKWRKMAALGRKRITFSMGNSKPTVVEKGHFVVYSEDQKRYSVPLAYLNNTIFVALLKMAEDEFGITGDGPISLPFDSNFLDYAMTLLRRNPSDSIQKALLSSMNCGRLAASDVPDNFCFRTIVCG